MSTAPEGWQSPKTNWTPVDPVGVSDIDRWEANSAAIETGNRTLDQTQTPTSHVGSLRQILSWLANRIKAITGGEHWYSAPATTLAAAKVHQDIDIATASPHGIRLGGGGVDAHMLNGKQWVTIVDVTSTSIAAGSSVTQALGGGTKPRLFLADVFSATASVVRGPAQSGIITWHIECVAGIYNLFIKNGAGSATTVKFTVLEWK